MTWELAVVIGILAYFGWAVIQYLRHPEEFPREPDDAWPIWRGKP